MTKKDRVIKEYLQQELGGLSLVESRKARLHQAMRRELASARKSLPERLVQRLKIFWDSTFELNLAVPVAAAAFMLLVGGAALFGPELFAPRTEQPRQLVYLPQTVGGTGADNETAPIAFIPVERQ